MGDDYICAAAYKNIVCKADLSFWLASPNERLTRYKHGETKCVNFFSSEISKGTVGNVCRFNITNQCDPGLSCTLYFYNILSYLDTLPQIQTYLSSLNITRSALNPNYQITPTNSISSDENYYLAEYIINNYYYYSFVDDKMTNNKDYANIYNNWGVCLPDSMTNIDSCGDQNELACYDSIDVNYYCFNDLKYSWQTYICGNCGGQGQEPCMGEDDLASQPVCNNPLIMKPDPLNTDLLTCQP